MDVTVTQIMSLIDSDDLQQQRQITSVVAAEDVWLALIEARPEVKRSVTLNKHLPDRVLGCLARDQDPEVRIAIAMKRRLPVEVFTLLASDVDAGVRHRIALNPKTPKEVLVRLADDPSVFVSGEARRRLAHCPAP